MPSYMQSWKTFRRISDENEVTARVLLSMPSWPSLDRTISILDVGTGDGLLISRLISQVRNKVDGVTLVEPDAELLQEALAHLNTSNSSVAIEPVLRRIEEMDPKELHRYDVVLAVHLVYLLRDGVLEDLLHAVGDENILYIVLDHPESIFSQLWKRTAPDYYRRVKRAHAQLSSLGAPYIVETRKIESSIRDFDELEVGDQRRIISIMSYAEYNIMSSSDQELVKQTIRQSMDGDSITCTSVCYEIKRLSSGG